MGGFGYDNPPNCEQPCSGGWDGYKRTERPLRTEQDMTTPVNEKTIEAKAWGELIDEIQMRVREGFEKEHVEALIILIRYWGEQNTNLRAGQTTPERADAFRDIHAAWVKMKRQSDEMPPAPVLPPIDDDIVPMPKVKPPVPKDYRLPLVHEPWTPDAVETVTVAGRDFPVPADTPERREPLAKRFDPPELLEAAIPSSRPYRVPLNTPVEYQDAHMTLYGIADRLDIEVEHVRDWIFFGMFPEPIGSLNLRPVWSCNEVDAWEKAQQ